MPFPNQRAARAYFAQKKDKMLGQNTVGLSPGVVGQDVSGQIKNQAQAMKAPAPFAPAQQLRFPKLKKKLMGM